MVNSPTVKGNAKHKTAGTQEIGEVPNVALMDREMPKDIMLTPTTSIMYLIANFLSMKNSPSVTNKILRNYTIYRLL